MPDIKKKICSIVNDLQAAAASNAEQKVAQILEVSTNYLSESNLEKLKLFQELYFAKNTASTQRKENVNSGVDDIFSQAKELIDSGKSDDEVLSSIQENEKSEKDRLQLAGLQKKLESLIALEDGLKDQLAPVINSMQFEDAARQRVEHIAAMFTTIVERSVANNPSIMQETAEELEKHLAIREERESYYKHVLHEESPEHLEQEQDDFFFNLSA